MADHSRLDDLRRRVEKDPASIAFAQLAEEYRRAGQIEESVHVCRAGLDIHPGYLSARVTLGRALIELNQLDDGQTELEYVLQHAPENLAAIRGLAEIHHRRGDLPDALDQYRAALALARNDPDLERTVEELARKVQPQVRPEPTDALSLDQMHEALLAPAPESKPASASAPVIETALESTLRAQADRQSSSETVDVEFDPSTFVVDSSFDLEALAPAASVVTAVSAAPVEPVAEDIAADPSLVAPAFDPAAAVAVVASAAPPLYNGVPDATRDRAHRTIAALEQWLDALNVSHTHCGA